MIKKGIFHPELLKVLAELRHRDMLMIGDAGLPIPKGVTRIDLGWIEGEPRFMKVFDEILNVLTVEEYIFANESKEVSPDFHKEQLKRIKNGEPVKYISHEELKKMSESAKAIILTGEFTPYTNVIMVCGCAY